MSRFYPAISIDLRSERDKSVYFWSLCDYLQSLLGKRSKHCLVFLLSEKTCSPPSCLFCQQPQQLLRKQILWNLLLSVHLVVKLNYLSSCFKPLQAGGYYFGALVPSVIVSMYFCHSCTFSHCTKLNFLFEM